MIRRGVVRPADLSDQLDYRAMAGFRDGCWPRFIKSLDESRANAKESPRGVRRRAVLELRLIYGRRLADCLPAGQVIARLNSVFVVRAR